MTDAVMFAVVLPLGLWLMRELASPQRDPQRSAILCGCIAIAAGTSQLVEAAPPTVSLKYNGLLIGAMLLLIAWRATKMRSI
jgi:hypothetical protein